MARALRRGGSRSRWSGPVYCRAAGMAHAPVRTPGRPWEAVEISGPTVVRDDVDEGQCTWDSLSEPGYPPDRRSFSFVRIENIRTGFGLGPANDSGGSNREGVWPLPRSDTAGQPGGWVIAIGDQGILRARGSVGCFTTGRSFSRGFPHAGASGWLIAERPPPPPAEGGPPGRPPHEVAERHGCRSHARLPASRRWGPPVPTMGSGIPGMWITFRSGSPKRCGLVGSRVPVRGGAGPGPVAWPCRIAFSPAHPCRVVPHRERDACRASPLPCPYSEAIRGGGGVAPDRGLMRRPGSRSPASGKGAGRTPRLPRLGPLLFARQRRYRSGGSGWCWGFSPAGSVPAPSRTVQWSWLSAVITPT